MIYNNRGGCSACPRMQVHKRKTGIVEFCEFFFAKLGGRTPEKWRYACAGCGFNRYTTTWKQAMIDAQKAILHDCTRHPEGFGLAA